jgi:hypothetical protein
MAAFGAPSRYAPTSSKRATSASIRPSKGLDPYAAQQQRNRDMAEFSRQDALNQQQKIAASNAGYQARNFGVDVTAKGQGPTGPWQVSAPGSSPVDMMSGRSSARATSSRSAASGGSGYDGYEDLSMNDYHAALGQQPTVPPRVAGMTMASRKPAEDAAYGRARDAAGSEMRAAGDSLADEMSARGLAGAGLEGALLGGILQKGQGQLGEVNRELAVDRMKRADEIQTQNYQGEIGQRANDINAGEQRVSNAMRLAELLRRRKKVV